MGHKITDIRYHRYDFVDEDYLHAMYNKLQSNPINSYYFGKNWQRRNISSKQKKSVLLSIITQILLKHKLNHQQSL